MHQLLLAQGGRLVDISAIVGGLSWSSDIDSLGVQLKFGTGHDERYTPSAQVQLGDMVVLRSADEIMRGVVVTETFAGRGRYDYDAFDFAWYLNKSKIIRQFNDVQGDHAIREVLKAYGIPVGALPNIRIVVAKIYAAKTGAEIIADILESATKQLGIKYRALMRSGAFHAVPQNDLKNQRIFKVGTLPLSDPSRRRTLDGMKNSIVVYTGGDESYTELATVRDQALVRQYGLLQEIVSLNAEGEGEGAVQAQNIARNMLRDLGRVGDDGGFEMLGDDSVAAGQLIEVEEPITGTSGTFLVKSCTHSVAGGVHKMQLQWEVLQ